MRALLLCLLALCSGCALGLGRVTPAASALSNNDNESYTPSGDQSGVPSGMVRVTPHTDARVDTGDGFHLGAQAGVKVGRVVGHFGALPYSSGWSYDPHLDLLATMHSVGVGLSGSYLVQSVGYAGGFANGYTGPAVALEGLFSPTDALGLYAALGPTLGTATVGTSDKPDRFGKASAPGFRGQVGLDFQPVKSGTVALGARVELAGLATTSATIRGTPASFTGASGMLELYFAFIP